MPINPQVLQEIINRYGKKAVQAAVNIAKTKVQVPNMTGTATAAGTSLRSIPKTESTVGKELGVAAAALAAPAVVADAELLGPALVDFGKDLASFEAIDNTPRIWGGDRLSHTASDYAGRGVRAVLPDTIEEGPARAAELIAPFVMMAPEAIAGRAIESGAKKVAQALGDKMAQASASRESAAAREFARSNNFKYLRAPNTGEPIFWDEGNNRMYYRRDGQLLPVEGSRVAGSASPGNGGFYESPNSWRNSTEGYGLADRSRYPTIADSELDDIARMAREEGFTQNEFVDLVERTQAENQYYLEEEARLADEEARRWASQYYSEPEIDRLVADLGMEEQGISASPESMSGVFSLGTDTGATTSSLYGRSLSGREILPDMDISGMNYDDLTSVLNRLSSSGMEYSDVLPLRTRIEHAIDHNGEDLWAAWDRMAPEDVVSDALGMYPGAAEDLLSSYGSHSSRMPDLLDAVEYASGTKALGYDTGELIDDYLFGLSRKYSAYASRVGSSKNAYNVDVSPLTPLESADLRGVAKVLNHKLGRKAGVDFTDYDTVEKMAGIQKALRDNDLVDVTRAMPLDIEHMAYFSDDTAAMSDAGRRAMRTVDEQLPGTANLVDDTSTASTPMRPGIAAKRYGTDPGKVTVAFKEKASDPSGYLYVPTNHYDTGFNFSYDPSGNLIMANKLPAAIRKYVDPNFDPAAYSFTPEEYSHLHSSNARAMYPELYDRWHKMINIADKAAIGQMWKYQDALQGAIQKSGIPGTESFVVPRARFVDRSNWSFRDTYQPAYEFPWMGIYRHNLGGFLHTYPNGGKIHIAPSKRGTFTAAAKKHGKSVQAFASQVLAHKENYSPAMVKKANFARNAAKWHEDGGFLQEYPDGGRIKGRRSGKFFVTELGNNRERKFQDWYANAASVLGLNPDPDAYEHAYDYRGYWLNNKNADVSSPDFHFPDTWKQPHHPTFSNESIYAKGREGVGHWEGDTFVPGPFNNLMQATEQKTPISPDSPVSYGSNYTPSDEIIQYIKDTEAFRDKWYQDGNGVWTIGYGFTGDDVRKRYPNGMTRAEADKYFADTVSTRIPMFVQATPNFDKLNQNQRDALFSYYYNIGHGGYTEKSPNMQAGLRNMDLDTVVNNIDFGYNDKKNRGLRKRRDYERNLFATPMDYGGILNRLKSVYGDAESIRAAILRAKNVKKSV